MPDDLKAWLDGELSAPRVLLVRAHLLFCPACREEITWLRRLGEDMRDLERAVPSPRLRARILAALPDAAPGRPAPSRLVSRPARFALATAFGGLCVAACAAGALIATGAFRRPAPAAVVAQQPGPRLAVHAETADPPAPDNAVHPSPMLDSTPDEFNRYANSAVERLEELTAQQKHAAVSRNRASYASMVVEARTRTDRGPQNAHPIPMELAVADPDSAADRLKEWARSVGGDAGAPPPGTASQMTVAPPVITTDPRIPVPAARPRERLVSLRVPKSAITSLEPVLVQVGALRSVARKPATGRKHAAPPIHRTEGPGQHSVAVARPGAPAQDPAVKPDSMMPQASVGAEPRTVAPPAAVVATGYAAQSAGRDGDGLITLQVRLTGYDAPLP